MLLHLKKYTFEVTPYIVGFFVIWGLLFLTALFMLISFNFWTNLEELLYVGVCEIFGFLALASLASYIKGGRKTLKLFSRLFLVIFFYAVFQIPAGFPADNTVYFIGRLTGVIALFYHLPRTVIHLFKEISG